MTIGKITQLARVADRLLQMTSLSIPSSANVDIPPGGVVEIGDFRSAIFAGQLHIGSAASDVNGGFSLRAAGSVDHMTKMYGTPTVVGVATDLTGTTGTAGNVTVGIRGPGRIVIENRRSGTVTINYLLSAGM